MKEGTGYSLPECFNTSGLDLNGRSPGDGSGSVVILTGLGRFVKLELCRTLTVLHLALQANVP